MSDHARGNPREKRDDGLGDDLEGYRLEDLQDDLMRRQWRPRMPDRISHVVNRLARRRGYFQDLTDSNWSEVWLNAAGSRLAKMTRVGRLRRGVLEIYVENSTTLQELAFEKSRLLKKMRLAMPEARLDDLKFRLGATT